MKKNAENKSRNDSLNLIIMQCFINSLITFFLFLALTSLLSAASKNSIYISNNSRIILFAILAAVSIVNGTLCAFRIKIKAILSSSVSALFFSALVFILFAVINKFSFSINSLIGFVIIAVFTVVSSIIIKNFIR